MGEKLSKVYSMTPEGQLIESEQMQEDRLQRIGQKKIETWPSHVDYVTGEEATSMSVAEIDEKMLDLELGDMDNSANTKTHNELRDMRDFLIHMGTVESGYAKVQELELAGKTDEVNIAKAGLELTSNLSSRADGRDNAKPAIKAYNERVVQNAGRRKVLEQNK